MLSSHINRIINYSITCFCLTSLTALHAVEDETQEDEGIVAIVNFDIFYNPLAHLSKVAGFGKLALVHKAGPRTNGNAAPVEPFFGYTGWESFWEPEPVEVKKRYHLYALMSEKTNISDISPTKNSKHSDNSHDNNDKQRNCFSC